MRQITLLFALVLTLGVPTFSQQCKHSSFATSGGWKDMASAPRNGTVVEILNAFGWRPWYGRFKFTHDETISFSDGSKERVHHDSGIWLDVDNPAQSMDNESCMYWRPYAGPAKYVDPTHGAQDTDAYWRKSR
jgi:hypothetical protein